MEDLMEDGGINSVFEWDERREKAQVLKAEKSMTGWKAVTRAPAINLHQSRGKEEKWGSLTKGSMAIPPSLSRVNDNIHYVNLWPDGLRGSL